MAVRIRVGLLAKVVPAAGTRTRLYTAPTVGFMVTSKIRIVNRGAATTFGVWIGNVTDVLTDLTTISYPSSTPIPAVATPGSIYEISNGDGVQNGGFIDVVAATGNTTFQVFGEERDSTP